MQLAHIWGTVRPSLMRFNETVVLWKGGTLTFLGVGRGQEAGVAHHAVDVPWSVFQHVVAEETR